ncbi:hypothetical protein [Tsukamurella paurometabola]|uniref:Uncharacterized protein n=1 Tax=Tsukamurella paurometabola TaxID=2061 RepID=A0ABS5NHE1_TSUPA|nr:hypothetical protein [Tsukamurella paurometabola]MBS4102848.1 hypothetical protein [Tsukamurella paurometabola]
MSFDITPGDGIAGELELLGDLIVGGFPEAVFTLPGVNVDEVLDHARLYLGFADAAETAQAKVKSLELPEFVGVEGEFFHGRVPGELAMQLGAAADSYSRVGSGLKELARELDASQAALKPLEARARAVFEHMQRVWIKVNVPFTEYSGLRSEWDELVRAAGVVHERVTAAGQQAAAAIKAGTEAMVPVNDYFSTLPAGGAVTGGALARGVRSTAARAVSSAGGVAGAPGRAAKAAADGLGAVAGAALSVPGRVSARGQQLADQGAEVTAYGARVGDQLITDPRSEAAQRLVREGRATNLLGVDPSGVPTAMLMLASPNTLIREQPRKKTKGYKPGQRWTTATSRAETGTGTGADTTTVSSGVVTGRRWSALSTVFGGAAGAAGAVRGGAGAVGEGAAGLARDSRGVWVVGEQIAQAAQRVAQVAGNVEQLAALTSWAATQTAAGQLPHAAAKAADAAVGQLITVPGRFLGGYASIVTDGISGTAALLGIGGDPVRAWSGLGWNILNPAKGLSRFAVAASPLEAAADPVYAAGAATMWGTNAAIAAVPFAWVVTLPLTFTLGTAQTLLRPGLLSRIEAIKTLGQSLDAATEQHLQHTAQQATANTSQVQVTTPDVDIHTDRGGYVTFTLPDLEGGEPKAWYILATPDSPGNFTTNVPTQPGEVLVERADGSVVLTNTVTGQTVRTIKAPWAKDALGRDQPTWYSIERVDDSTSTVTQHIAPNKGALYPLVADAVAGAQIKPPTEAQIASVTGPTVQTDKFSGPTSTNAVNAPYERPQGSAGTTTTPPAQAEPYKPDPGTRPGSPPKVDPKPYTPNPAPAAPVAPPKPDTEPGQDDDKQPDTYVGAVTDSSFRDVSDIRNDADPTINPNPSPSTSTGAAATDDKSAELTRLVQSGMVTPAMLQALGYKIDANGKVVKDTPTGPPVSVELSPDLAQSPVAGLIVPHLQAGGAQVKVKEPVPGTPQDNDISSVSIGDPAKQVDTHLVRGDGATSRTQTTRNPDGSLDTVTETFDGARIDGHTTLGPDGKPVASSWNDSAGNRGTVDNTTPEQRTRVQEANGSVSGIVTTGEIGNVYKVTTLTPSGEVIRTATTDTGRDSNVELLPNPDMGALPEGTNGRREGDTWITHLANGDRVENTIPFGNGNRTVDQTIYGPDGKITHSRVVSDGAGGWQRWNNDSTGEASYASKPGLDGWTNVANFAPGAATTGAPTSQSLITPNFKEAVQRTPDGGYIRSKIVPDTTGVHGGADSVETTTVDSDGNTTVTMSRPAPFLGGGPVTTTTAQYDHNGDGWFINDRGQKFLRTGNTITTTDPATGNKIVTQLAPADPRSPDPAIRDREQVTATRTYSPDGKLVSAVFGEGQIRPGMIYGPDGTSMQVEFRPDGTYGRNQYNEFRKFGDDGRLATDGFDRLERYYNFIATGQPPFDVDPDDRSYGTRLGNTALGIVRGLIVLTNPFAQAAAQQAYFDDPQTRAALSEHRWNDAWHQSAGYLPQSQLVQQVWEVGKSAVNYTTAPIDLNADPDTMTPQQRQQHMEQLANLDRRGKTFGNNISKLLIGTDFLDPSTTWAQKAADATLGIGMFLVPVKGIGALGKSGLKIPAELTSGRALAFTDHEFAPGTFYDLSNQAIAKKVPNPAHHNFIKGTMGELLTEQKMRNADITGIRREDRYPAVAIDTKGNIEQLLTKKDRQAMVRPDRSATVDLELLFNESKYGRTGLNPNQASTFDVLATRGIDDGTGTNPGGVPLSSFPEETRVWIEGAVRRRELDLSKPVTVLVDYWAKELAANPALLRQAADLATELKHLDVLSEWRARQTRGSLLELAASIERYIADNSRFANITPAQLIVTAGILNGSITHPEAGAATP